MAGSNELFYDVSLWIDRELQVPQIGLAVSWAKDEEFYGTFGVLGRVEYNPRRKPYPQPGKFTLVLPSGETSAPQGDGYGIVTVDAGGKVKIVGELADGTPWSAAAPITNMGLASLDSVLYDNGGSISGTLKLPEQSDTDEWTWFKNPRSGDIPFPNGFTTELAARLSPYSPPVNGNRVIELSTAECILSNGNLADPVHEVGTLSQQNIFQFTPASVEQLQLQIDPATGKVTGSFKHPVNHRIITLSGVVEQEKASIRGFFLGGDASGHLKVGATP